MTQTTPPDEPTSAAPTDGPAGEPAPAPADESVPGTRAGAGEDAPVDSGPVPPPVAVEAVPVVPAPPVVVSTLPPKVRRCENCGTPLLGEHCYACGQPTKGLIRQFGTILGDFFDTVFQIDSRVLRTLGPLLFKPGALTLEYFAGHRIRYVSPVRLFFFLSVLAFLAAQWSLNFNVGEGDLNIGVTDDGDTVTLIERAQTPEDVIRIRDEAVAAFERGKARGKDVPGLAVGMDAAAREIRAEADARLKELALEARAAPKPPAAPSPPGGVLDAPASPPAVGPPPGDRDDDGNGPSLSFNGKPWDAQTNPIGVSWLPAAVNARFNVWAGRAKSNIQRMQKEKDGNLLKDAFLSVVPQTLFLLLPLFALLLKVLYLFKRRLYMEHLVVALHSHAFLCLVLLLQSLLSLAQGAVAAEGSTMDGVFGFVEVILWIWAPLYLLLMQKRVYGQGWILTVLKFGLIGMAYVMLLGIAAGGTFLVALVRM